jgi:hypothetical protein
VPHHYFLSIDVQSPQDSHVDDAVVQVELSGHVEIPTKDLAGPMIAPLRQMIGMQR